MHMAVPLDFRWIDIVNETGMVSKTTGFFSSNADQKVVPNFPEAQATPSRLPRSSQVPASACSSSSFLQGLMPFAPLPCRLLACEIWFAVSILDVGLWDVHGFSDLCWIKLLVLYKLAFKHGRVTNNDYNLNFEYSSSDLGAHGWQVLLLRPQHVSLSHSALYVLRSTFSKHPRASYIMNSPKPVQVVIDEDKTPQSPSTSAKRSPNTTVPEDKTTGQLSYSYQTSCQHSVFWRLWFWARVVRN